MTQKMSYSNEEKETILRFDYIDQCWYVETNVASHITKISKVTEVEIITVSENENPTMITARLEKECVLIRNKPKKVEMTEEQRLKRSEHMKRLRESKISSKL